MNGDGPFIFRTTRGARDRVLPREAQAGESVVPLALHRAAMEASQKTLRRVEAEPPQAKPLETEPQKAPEAAFAPTPEPLADTGPEESIGPEQPIAAFSAPEAALPERIATLPAVRTTGKLYLVTRARGGMGATTFAVNLALGLAGSKSKGKSPVALVDLDLQFGTVASSLDMVDRGGMLALVQLPQEPDSMAVRTALQQHESGLFVLAGPKRPVPLDALDSMRVASILTALLASHDSVVVDLPHALVTWLEPLLRRATRVFMVTDLAVTSIDSARRVLDTLREDRADLPVEVIVTREKKPLFSSKVPAEVSAALEAPVRHWLADDPKLAREALDRGNPVMKAAPSSTLAKGIRKIAEELDA